jgi:hypothetical protein
MSSKLSAAIKPEFNSSRSGQQKGNESHGKRRDQGQREQRGSCLNPPS